MEPYKKETMDTLSRFFRKGRQARGPGAPTPRDADEVEATSVEIAPNDPLVGYFQTATGAVDIDALELDSPARRSLVEAGMKLIVPLVSQGELIGLLNLGPRLSERDYSGDDRKLLDNLAAHAAPAVRVAQLVRQQEAEVRTRERLEQELRVAQLIQQQFLPKELPRLSGWHVAAYYQPARAVGGDFYDFLELPDGQVGLVVGDVTDKGVPAALVMATTHSILRGDGPRLVSPSAVLKRANDRLYPDIPAHMFVTCLYAVLDPSTGRVRYANAGHNVPYVQTDSGVTELRATGMPLGLMPDMEYEENEAYLAPGESVLLHSDGLVEAHNEQGEMFGFPRLMDLVENSTGSHELIDGCLQELRQFTGANWDQEDDITLVTLQRATTSTSTVAMSGAAASDMTHPLRRVEEIDGPPADTSGGEEEAEEQAPEPAAPGQPPAEDDDQPAGERHPPAGENLLAEFNLPSEPGNERIAMQRIVEAVEPLKLPSAQLDKLKTAAAEATMNAIEHGNHNDPEVPVAIRVASTSDDLFVSITDRGAGRPIPSPETPDIEAKLEGLQTPRGWGLFLIKNMVDDMEVSGDDSHHTIKLVLRLKGNDNGK